MFVQDKTTKGGRKGEAGEGGNKHDLSETRDSRIDKMKIVPLKQLGTRYCKVAVNTALKSPRNVFFANCDSIKQKITNVSVPVSDLLPPNAASPHGKPRPSKTQPSREQILLPLDAS